MRKTFVPSKYQSEIFDVYEKTRNNIVIEAVPGSGKTTTLLELLKRTPFFKRTIFLAFNKSIADELRIKVSEGTKVSTIHSLGMGILMSKLTCKVKVNAIKNWILGQKCLNMSKFRNEKEKSNYLFAISWLVDLYRMNCGKGIEDMQELAVTYNIPTLNGEIKDAFKLLDYLKWYNAQEYEYLMIDFVDMLDLTVQLVPEEEFPKYDVVMVDELQDLNPLQRKIIERIIKPRRGRFVGCGDKKQAIYSFMGSNLESFKSFQDRPNTVTLPLSVCYRCGTKIIDEANKIFDIIEPFEENEDGIVRTGDIDEMEGNDFILCRNNVPLIEAYIYFLKKGVKSTIMGKDYSKGLLSIIQKVRYDPNPIPAMRELLNNKMIQLKEKGVPNPKNNAGYLDLMERTQIIKILYDNFDEDFSIVSNSIETMFDDNKKEGITLSTIHKAKGLESDRVGFLLPQLIPSMYAKSQMELYQEKCLYYVAVTRAKKELIYIKSFVSKMTEMNENK